MSAIELSKQPELSGANLKLLTALWIALHRAEYAGELSERDTMLKIFDRVCTRSKVHAPTIRELFRHTIPVAP